TEIDRADLLDVQLCYPINRRRKRQADPGAKRRAVAAEAGDDTALSWRDRVKTGEDQPQQDHSGYGPQDQRTIGPAWQSAAAAAKARPAAAQEFVERGDVGPAEAHSAAAAR